MRRNWFPPTSLFITSTIGLSITLTLTPDPNCNLPELIWSIFPQISCKSARIKTPVKTADWTDAVHSDQRKHQLYCGVCRILRLDGIWQCRLFRGRRLFLASSKLVAIVRSTVERCVCRHQLQRLRRWFDDLRRSGRKIHVRRAVVGIGVEAAFRRFVRGNDLRTAWLNRPALIIRCAYSRGI